MIIRLESRFKSNYSKKEVIRNQGQVNRPRSKTWSCGSGKKDLTAGSEVQNTISCSLIDESNKSPRQAAGRGRLRGLVWHILTVFPIWAWSMFTVLPNCTYAETAGGRSCTRLHWSCFLWWPGLVWKLFGLYPTVDSLLITGSCESLWH